MKTLLLLGGVAVGLYLLTRKALAASAPTTPPPASPTDLAPKPQQIVDPEDPDVVDINNYGRYGRF